MLTSVSLNPHKRDDEALMCSLKNWAFGDTVYNLNSPTLAITNVIYNRMDRPEIA